MDKLVSFALRFMIVLALSGSTISPRTAQVDKKLPAAQSQHPYRDQTIQEVPAEVKALFENGMPVEEFLALNQGPIPQALQQFADIQVKVIVEMEQAPLAQVYARQQTDFNMPPSPDAQRAYQDSLNLVQNLAVSSLVSLGGMVIDRYTKAYNGLLVSIALSQVPAIGQIPGVKAVYRAPVHVPNLSFSIPLINADQVHNSLANDGSGIRIAVIDTGIDYTHAVFGGSGDPGDYETNDPDIIEPGTFPNGRVIGGYDFAGTDYDAASNIQSKTIPHPDNDPLDENGHGTHVASIAAGAPVSPTLGTGVAPGAEIYALKVFGAEGSTDLTVSAIEWAMDPDKDGDLSDHVDVINMSLGSKYGTASDLDPTVAAADLASKIGIVVVSSAGNNGDVSYITGSPASADSVISVAASTTGFATGPTVSIPESTDESLKNIVYQPSNFDNNTGHFTDTITAPLFYAGEIPGASNDLLCSISGLASDSLSGAIALIQRGTCGFSIKVNNAASLGAVAVIIFNHEDGGDSRSVMGVGTVLIPAGFTGHSAGVALTAAHGENGVITAENEVISVADSLPADIIGDFSSRGPRGLDSFTKPDITAPGAGIFAAKMGSGTAGVSFNGTSMAAPHVAGVAALILNDHPDWVPEQVKAAIMNTAVDLADEASAQVPRQGSGRVDAEAAVTTDSLAIGDQDQVALSWGVIPLETNGFIDQKQITLINFSDQPKDYDVRVEIGSKSLQNGFDLTVPETVEVGPSPGIAYVPVELALDASQLPLDFLRLEEYYGYVIFSNPGDASDVLRVPFYAIPQPYSRIALFNSSLLNASGQIQITHTGPISSSLWAYPLYVVDEDEPGQGNQADLRMMGMDYGWTHETYGPIFVPAINVHGSWFTPQPYFAEFDLHLDVDQNGSSDLVDFNFNLGWFSGAGDNDQWVVIQVNLNSGLVFLGSPFLIYSDYNSGYMEWYLPATWNGLNANTNTDFNFRLRSFDFDRNMDDTPAGYFDFARPPFSWSLTNQPGPDGSSATLSFQVNDAGGYLASDPLGLMIVDYNGKPGTGQAHDYQFTFEKPFIGFMPAVTR